MENDKLKELMRTTFNGSVLHSTFDHFWEHVGAGDAAEFRATLIKPKMEEIEKYIKSIDRVMKSLTE